MFVGSCFAAVFPSLAPHTFFRGMFPITVYDAQWEMLSMWSMTCESKCSLVPPPPLGVRHEAVSSVLTLN